MDEKELVSTLALAPGNYARNGTFESLRLQMSLIIIVARTDRVQSTVSED